MAEAEATLEAPGAEEDETSSLGMWTFLATEVLFFGALFAAYTVYRLTFPEAFAEASHHLYLSIGATNTGVLLVSSLTMALAVHVSAAHGQTEEARPRRKLLGLLLVTAALGAVFLGLKGVEYFLDWRERLVPGPGFREVWSANPRHAQLFMVLYFIITGLHAVHLTIAVGLVLLFALLIWRRKLARLPVRVEMLGLYWHFVDVVWVFLFPLLYLVE